MAKRKSVAERRREAREAERDAFQNFADGLNQMNSFEEILAAVDTPERFGPHVETFLSNLGFFLGHNFAVPNGATRKELGLYERLVERFDGGLAERAQVIARLQAARREQGRAL